jgi:hypothetical protein
MQPCAHKLGLEGCTSELNTAGAVLETRVVDNTEIHLVSTLAMNRSCCGQDGAVLGECPTFCWRRSLRQRALVVLYSAERSKPSGAPNVGRWRAQHHRTWNITEARRKSQE